MLRDTAHANGALLVLDEVMTGFRVSAAGWYGLESVPADLVTFGKVMGGGFPAAAFGGRADLMALLAPDGPVYQAGTLSGNPVATTAGLTTLRLADEGVYAALDRVADEIGALVGKALEAEGVPHLVQRAGATLLPRMVRVVVKVTLTARSPVRAASTIAAAGISGW